MVVQSSLTLSLTALVANRSKRQKQLTTITKCSNYNNSTKCVKKNFASKYMPLYICTYVYLCKHLPINLQLPICKCSNCSACKSSSAAVSCRLLTADSCATTFAVIMATRCEKRCHLPVACRLTFSYLLCTKSQHFFLYNLQNSCTLLAICFWYKFYLFYLPCFRFSLFVFHLIFFSSIWHSPDILLIKPFALRNISLFLFFICQFLFQFIFFLLFAAFNLFYKFPFIKWSTLSRIKSGKYALVTGLENLKTLGRKQFTVASGRVLTSSCLLSKVRPAIG